MNRQSMHYCPQKTIAQPNKCVLDPPLTVVGVSAIVDRNDQAEERGRRSTIEACLGRTEEVTVRLRGEATRLLVQATSCVVQVGVARRDPVLGLGPASPGRNVFAKVGVGAVGNLARFWR